MMSPSTVTVKVTWSNISKTYPPLEDSLADKIFSVYVYVPGRTSLAITAKAPQSSVSPAWTFNGYNLVSE